MFLSIWIQIDTLGALACKYIGEQVGHQLCQKQFFDLVRLMNIVYRYKAYIDPPQPPFARMSSFKVMRDYLMVDIYTIMCN